MRRFFYVKGTAMATTSLWRIKGAIGDVIRYAENEKKTTKEILPTAREPTTGSLDQLIAYASREEATNRRQLITGINCSPERARQEMMAVKKAFGKTNGTIAYHGYQSFAEGEVTPEQAHQIGIKLANELWGDRFQVLVATHLDKQSHLHNHFVLNTVSFVDGRKYHRTRADYKRMREVSDRLCREERLSVIEENYGHAKQYSEWDSDKKSKPTYRSMVRDDIDRAIQVALTEQEFFQTLSEMGYEFKFYSKNGIPLQRPSLKPKDSERFFRFDRLGEDYSLDEIYARILENNHRIDPFPESERKKVRQRLTEYTPRKKAHGLIGLYRYYCYLLKITVDYPNSVKKLSSAAREDLRNIERLDQEVNLLAANHIETGEGLEKFLSDAREKIDEHIKGREVLRNRLRREIRKDDIKAVEKTKEEIAEVTAELKELRSLLGIGERIQRRSSAVNETVEDLEQQLVDTKEPEKKEKTEEERS